MMEPRDSLEGTVKLHSLWGAEMAKDLSFQSPTAPPQLFRFPYFYFLTEFIRVKLVNKII